MKKTLLNGLFFSFIFTSSISCSQEKEGVKTIKIEKEKLFVKAAFDETEYKVIAFDRYGNPHENAIKSFAIYYKDNKTAYQASVNGNTFPKSTIDFLTKKKKQATKICLTNLKGQDKDGNEEDLPDLCDIVIFPNCKKVNKTK